MIVVRDAQSTYFYFHFNEGCHKVVSISKSSEARKIIHDRIIANGMNVLIFLELFRFERIQISYPSSFIIQWEILRKCSSLDLKKILEN